MHTCFVSRAIEPEIASALRRATFPSQAWRLLILGSASRDLIRQSSESLAGRIASMELTPFRVIEPAARVADRNGARGQPFNEVDGSATLQPAEHAGT